VTISLNRLDKMESHAAGVSFIGGRVRAIRQSVGYSIDELALTCGLTNSEIAGVEEGLDADPARLKRIAAALQVSLSDFMEN